MAKEAAEKLTLLRPWEKPGLTPEEIADVCTQANPNSHTLTPKPQAPHPTPRTQTIPPRTLQ